MTSSGESDASWAQLAQLSEEERVQLITERYRSFATLGEEERRVALQPLIDAEYSLDDAQLRAITVSRMRTWLTLSPEEARAVSASYDGVMQKMPAQAAMRRIGLVQSLSVEFSAEDEDRLRELLPSVFAGAPRRGAVAETAAPPLTRPEAPARRRPWWAFWQKA